MSMIDDFETTIAQFSATNKVENEGQVIKESSENIELDSLERFIKVQGSARELQQTIFIPKCLHAKMMMIVNIAFDGKLSLAGFVSNILAAHLEDHKDKYNKLISEQMKQRAL